jgi:hypothetical protein
MFVHVRTANIEPKIIPEAALSLSTEHLDRVGRSVASCDMSEASENPYSRDAARRRRDAALKTRSGTGQRSISSASQPGHNNKCKEPRARSKEEGGLK